MGHPGHGQPSSKAGEEDIFQACGGLELGSAGVRTGEGPPLPDLGTPGPDAASLDHIASPRVGGPGAQGEAGARTVVVPAVEEGIQRRDLLEVFSQFGRVEALEAASHDSAVLLVTFYAVESARAAQAAVNKVLSMRFEHDEPSHPSEHVDAVGATLSTSLRGSFTGASGAGSAGAVGGARVARDTLDLEFHGAGGTVVHNASAPELSDLQYHGAGCAVMHNDFCTTHNASNAQYAGAARQPRNSADGAHGSVAAGPRLPAGAERGQVWQVTPPATPTRNQAASAGPSAQRLVGGLTGQGAWPQEQRLVPSSQMDIVANLSALLTQQPSGMHASTSADGFLFASPTGSFGAPCAHTLGQAAADAAAAGVTAARSQHMHDVVTSQPSDLLAMHQLARQLESMRVAQAATMHGHVPTTSAFPLPPGLVPCDGLSGEPAMPTPPLPAPADTMVAAAALLQRCGTNGAQITQLLQQVAALGSAAQLLGGTPSNSRPGVDDAAALAHIQRMLLGLPTLHSVPGLHMPPVLVPMPHAPLPGGGTAAAGVRHGAERLSRRASSTSAEVGSPPGQNRMFALDPNAIAAGRDVRTTLMIRNIPNKYTQRMLLATINEHFRGLYDFFYLPIDFRNKCNVGYAFINMIDVAHVIPFHKRMHETRWERFNSEKVCHIAYARIQGKSALIAHFQNSSLMNQDKRCRPVIFYSDGSNAGQPEPFPVCHTVRARTAHND